MDYSILQFAEVFVSISYFFIACFKVFTTINLNCLYSIMLHILSLAGPIVLVDAKRYWKVKQARMPESVMDCIESVEVVVEHAGAL